ncbi:hypothetical protein FALBO_10518 [Fusarium albosuccineum]|uniref:Uncharacterized protein n=1 Tax=Fusarium albosuccineum TaxID=1237068 RepID=A0A8H4L7K4_9HYPO|nr:hypothetical protein FALBO_10518 [Fusarium albosuccineum]
MNSSLATKSPTRGMRCQILPQRLEISNTQRNSLRCLDSYSPTLHQTRPYIYADIGRNNFPCNQGSQMSLDIRPLNRPADFFTSNTEIVPKVIEGRGQDVCWKNCSNVYARHNDRAGTVGDWSKQDQSKQDQSSGEATVRVDVDVHAARNGELALFHFLFSIFARKECGRWFLTEHWHNGILLTIKKGKRRVGKNPGAIRAYYVPDLTLRLHLHPEQFLSEAVNPVWDDGHLHDTVSLHRHRWEVHRNGKSFL